MTRQTKDALTPSDRRRGRVLGTIAWIVAWCIGRTLRWTVIGREHVEAARRGGKICWASWHGRQLLTVDFHSGEPVVVLVSLSKDGEIQKAMLERFHYRVERGSSTRGAVRGLLTMGRAMREGWEPAIAVDGPVGPLHGVKQGIVALAKHESARIVPTMASATRGWVLPSWDRTFIPKPFSRAVMIYEAPMDVPDAADAAEVERLRARLEATLQEMTVRADGYFGERQRARLAAAHDRAAAREAERKARKAARRSAEEGDPPAPKEDAA
ncbi:MAG TPA: lysophospholipid acyltransferase family protein [bacterium]|nr:lysophospholipid acyltransferase family protein [bacterium]